MIFMTIENAVLRYFRAMDDETQVEAAKMFENLARDFPRDPRLRIVRAVEVDRVALPPLDRASQPFSIPFRK